MNQQLATVVFTDPPYIVPIDGHASGGQETAPRLRHGLRRDEPAASSPISRHGLQAARQRQPRWVDSFRFVWTGVTSANC